ncbi:hypothetical protein L211DRAFT_565348 [Terfezia boudieri ATCC MYA-4762]|uniref:Uncharacterized protein n=1 Tax=Terfezia boudieri ATCC MYA-4762 TaxID=1051890 RepID=A0A3N4M191_9PEZI|nr:hypothetical protein L211DRAFT_565348 [Terfezia boudieri ATCC MYA-4762]
MEYTRLLMILQTNHYIILVHIPTPFSPAHSRVGFQIPRQGPLERSCFRLHNANNCLKGVSPTSCKLADLQASNVASISIRIHVCIWIQVGTVVGVIIALCPSAVLCRKGKGFVASQF